MSNLKHAILAAFFCLFFISSCDGLGVSASKNNDEISFVPTFIGRSLTCDSTISHSNDSWIYTQLQFFISNIYLKDSSGQWQKATLEKSAFQTADVALIGENCNLSNEKSKVNWSIKFIETAALINSTHIRFTLGLPFTVNHLNPLTQESPLNVPTMFWGWQQGHKFLRLEMSSKSNDWLFHLGSVGCKSASPLRAPKQECLYPNRYIFELPIGKEYNHLVFELSTLLKDITLSNQTSCQSSPNKQSCQLLFSNLQEKNPLAVFQNSQQEISHE